MNILSKQISAIIFAALFLVFFSFSLHAQEDESGRWINKVSEAWWFNDKLPKEEIESVKSRWNYIFDENLKDSNEWSGDYFIGGDTHGSYLRLAPQNGFVIFNVNKCMAQVQNFSYGKVTQTPSAILFFPEYESKIVSSHHQHNGSLSHKWLPVKWRNVHYLIPENEIENFGNYVAGFGSENAAFIEYFPFLLKLKDQQKGSAAEMPIFPAGYEGYIKRAINGKIIRIGKRIIKETREDEGNEEPQYQSETEVTLNIGKLQGVKEGMIFFMLNSDWYDSIKIKRVNANNSIGIVVRSLEESSSNSFQWKDSEIYSPLKVGWKVTTSPHIYSDFQQEQN